MVIPLESYISFVVDNFCCSFGNRSWNSLIAVSKKNKFLNCSCNEVFEYMT